MDFEVYISKFAFVFILNKVSDVAITHVFLVLLLQSFVIRNNSIPKFFCMQSAFLCTHYDN